MIGYFFSRNLSNLLQQWFICSIGSFEASNFARPATVAAASGPTEMGRGCRHWRTCPLTILLTREQKQIILLLCTYHYIIVFLTLRYVSPSRDLQISLVMHVLIMYLLLLIMYLLCTYYVLFMYLLCTYYVLTPNLFRLSAGPEASDQRIVRKATLYLFYC